jgi:hypothetical protein
MEQGEHMNSPRVFTDENLWVAVIDWNAIRQLEDLAVQAKY